MREIKFRAWDKKKKFLFIPSQLELTQGENFNKWDGWKPMAWRDELPEEGNGGIGRFIGEECEVMQYTGLKDKNGKEIYEGDIISTYKGYFVVEWDEIGGMFLFHEVKTDSPDGLLVIDYYEFEEGYSYYEFHIAGNVYENPELLEEANE